MDLSQVGSASMNGFVPIMIESAFHCNRKCYDGFEWKMELEKGERGQGNWYGERRSCSVGGGESMQMKKKRETFPFHSYNHCTLKDGARVQKDRKKNLGRGRQKI